MVADSLSMRTSTADSRYIVYQRSHLLLIVGLVVYQCSHLLLIASMLTSILLIAGSSVLTSTAERGSLSVFTSTADKPHSPN